MTHSSKSRYVRLVPALLLACLGAACTVRANGPDLTEDTQPATQPPNETTPDGLQIHDPVSCTGTEDIELQGVVIDTPDVAISIKGTCNVTVTGSRIIAGDVGIAITGTGNVVLRNSTVQGGQAAFVLSGTGDLSAKGTRFVGGKLITGTGEFRDRGGNTWE